MEEEKSDQPEEESGRSRSGCLLISLILLPIFYLLSYPWVEYGIIHSDFLSPDWLKDALDAIYAPIAILLDRSATFIDFYAWYDEMVFEYFYGSVGGAFRVTSQ